MSNPTDKPSKLEELPQSYLADIVFSVAVREVSNPTDKQSKLEELPQSYLADIDFSVAVR